MESSFGDSGFYLASLLNSLMRELANSHYRIRDFLRFSMSAGTLSTNCSDFVSSFLAVSVLVPFVLTETCVLIIHKKGEM